MEIDIWCRAWLCLLLDTRPGLQVAACGSPHFRKETFLQMDKFEKELLPVDIFICTADSTKEPPLNVVNTVVSSLAQNYPTASLSCYVSDDGGSALTFYALLEASRFAKFWVPFCRKYSINQRCPEAYFCETDVYQIKNSSFAGECEILKNMYDDMKYSINSTVERGTVPQEKCRVHEGFKEWSSGITSQNHPSIVEGTTRELLILLCISLAVNGTDYFIFAMTGKQILLEKGKDTDVDGHDLPSLIYVSREKRPGHPHNFKAGALSFLIRVSAVMNNDPFILTLDGDMYTNNCEALREALCFFMDPQTGHQIGYNLKFGWNRSPNVRGYRMRSPKRGSMGKPATT